MTDYLFLFCVPIFAFEETHNVAWSGVAVFAQWAPRLFSLLVASHFSDRWQMRLVLMRCDAIRCVAALAGAALVGIFNANSLIVLLGVAFVVGLCFEQTYVAGEKLARSIFPASAQEQVQASLTALEQASVVIGPALGSVFLSLPIWVFLASLAILNGLGLVLSSLVPYTSLAQVVSSPQSWRGALLTILGSVRMRRLIITAMGLNYLLTLVIGLSAGMTQTLFGLSSTNLALIFVLASVTAVVGLAAASPLMRRMGAARFGTTSALIMCATALGLGVLNSIGIYVALLTCLVAADAQFSVYMRTARVRLVPEHLYGGSVAMFGLLVVIPIPLAGLTIALLANSAGSQGLLAISAVAVAVLVLINAPRKGTASEYP